MRKSLKCGGNFLASMFLAAALCACGGSAGTDGAGSGGPKDAEVGWTGGAENAAGRGGGAGGASDGTENGGDHGSQAGGLRFLCTGEEAACSTEEGYYYLTGEPVPLQGGEYGSRLLYMDFASRREIYLCSTAGCGHDTADCPAVFPQDMFPSGSTRFFVYGDSLYILSRDFDNDGSVQEFVFSETGLDVAQGENSQVTLYRAGLDGTGRRAVCSFASELAVEDMVMGDEGGIYLVTKKVSTDRRESTAYTTSSERKLVRVDPQSGAVEELCSLEFGDAALRNVVGCYGRTLVLERIDYGREISEQEYEDDDVYKNLFLNSSEVYETLDIDSGSLREIWRTGNRTNHSAQPLGNILYVSDAESRNIRSICMDTGEEKEICTLSQGQIMGTMGDVLCCRDWNLSRDYTWYFVDTRTGEIRHSGLVNRYNGWALEFRAVLSSDVLAVYDYDAADHGDGSYEIYRYKYALISKEDLFAGNDHFREIEMIGTGH